MLSVVFHAFCILCNVYMNCLIFVAENAPNQPYPAHSCAHSSLLRIVLASNRLVDPFIHSHSCC